MPQKAVHGPEIAHEKHRLPFPEKRKLSRFDPLVIGDRAKPDQGNKQLNPKKGSVFPISGPRSSRIVRRIGGRALKISGWPDSVAGRVNSNPRNLSGFIEETFGRLGRFWFNRHPIQVSLLAVRCRLQHRGQRMRARRTSLVPAIEQCVCS